MKKVSLKFMGRHFINLNQMTQREFTKSNALGDTSFKPLGGVANVFAKEVKAGDEVIANYSTGGCYRSWFLGKTVSGLKYVCLTWFPHGDHYELTATNTPPVRSDWSLHVSGPKHASVLEQIEKFKESKDTSFLFDVTSK